MIKDVRKASVLRKDVSGMRGRLRNLGKCVLGVGSGVFRGHGMEINLAGLRSSKERVARMEGFRERDGRCGQGHSMVHVGAAWAARSTWDTSDVG